MLNLEEIVTRYGVGRTEAGLVQDRLGRSNIDFSEAEWSEIDGAVAEICRDLDIRKSAEPVRPGDRTPIERLAEVLSSRTGSNFAIVTILVPEQCMEVVMDGQVYHVSVDEEGE